jgi:hypothetical protein
MGRKCLPNSFWWSSQCSFYLRAVEVNRLVRRALSAGAQEREGRAQTAALYGDALLAHIVLQHLGMDALEMSDDESWQEVANEVPDLTDRALKWLIITIDAEYGSTSLISSTLTNPQRYRTLVQAVRAALSSGESEPELPREYRATADARKARRPNAVPTLIDAGKIADGTTVTLLPGSKPEMAAIGDWLAEDERRSTATWVNDRRRPLLWAVDGQRYSPSGLIMHLWEEAGWLDHPVAIQGPTRWGIPGKGSLSDLAHEVFSERDTVEE